jgi:hypothetical protein
MDLRPQASRQARDFAQRGIFLRAAAVVFAVGLAFWIGDAARERSVYALSTEAAAARRSKDETALQELAASRAENSRLTARLEALGERITSGEDILRALSQIKKRTPQTIRLAAFSTSRPRAAEEEEKESEGSDATFQARRTVYLRGYARSRKSHSDALLEVWRYQNSLRELGDLFRDVEQLYLHRVETEGADSTHVAEFVLGLRIAKWRQTQ